MPQETRPSDLPDFSDPPLNEVVLGVQFAQPKGYHQLLAGDVWNLFREVYPVPQELQAIPPAFEMFGLPQPGIGAFSFTTGAVHDRFWFKKLNGDELIQFQPDRLLHNWRKIEGSGGVYPRFERMITLFEAELKKLEQYFGTVAPQVLSINQCEISYMNHLVDDSQSPLKASDWLRFVDFDTSVEDFSVGFREIILGADNNPIGRLICEASTGPSANGRKLIGFNLTVRVAPSGSDINSALQAIKSGRKLIVTKFAELTTPDAHKKWGRST